MIPEILRYAEAYSHAKSALGHALGLSDDLLHVHVGLALFVLAALLTRRRMRSWWPLGIVAVFAVANEVIDYFGPDPWSDGCRHSISPTRWSGRWCCSCSLAGARTAR